MARQKGLHEERIHSLCDLERGGFSEGEKAALRFVQEFTLDAPAAGPSLQALTHHFTPEEIADIAIFCAWQSNGLRAIHSWDAHEALNRPDVPLAYADGPSLFVSRERGEGGEASRRQEEPRGGGGDNGNTVPGPLPVFPPFDREIRPDIEAIWKSWEELGTPPRPWLDFLAASPRALWGWAEFHRLTYEEGVLPRGIKARVLARLAELLDVPSWAPKVPPFIPPQDAHRERCALLYADALFGDYLNIDDDLFQEVSRPFTSGEMMELGKFIGMQLGSLKLAWILGVR